METITIRRVELLKDAAYELMEARRIRECNGGQLERHTSEYTDHSRHMSKYDVYTLLGNIKDEEVETYIESLKK